MSTMENSGPEPEAPVVTPQTPVAESEPVGMTAYVYFNKYYYDFLKSVKSNAKTHKESNLKSVAKSVLKSIQVHYSTFDKLSMDHIAKFEANMASWLHEDYLANPSDAVNNAMDNEAAPTRFVYEGIPLDSLLKLMPRMVVFNYMSTFGILLEAHNDKWNDEKIKMVLETMKDAVKQPSKVDDLENPRVRAYIRNVLKGPGLDEILDIQSTSLGQLAKEIVNDLNIGSSKENDEDLLEKLQSGEGIGSLISKVGNKLQEKLVNGELNQEKLLEDAVKLASKIPAMTGLAGLGGMGGAGAGGQGAGLNQTLEGLLGNVDFSSIMGQMQTMMGAMGMGGMGFGGAGPSAGAPNRGGHSSSGATRQRLVKKLKEKKAGNGI